MHMKAKDKRPWGATTTARLTILTTLVGIPVVYAGCSAGDSAEQVRTAEQALVGDGFEPFRKSLNL
jgi:hypothetical protein